jgi:hypothetical protein
MSAMQHALRANLARFPLCERENIGNFAALVGPGVDRPELIALAIPDHCGVVRGKPSDRRRNCMVLQQFELIENEQE